ncbi:potassium channel family protein [Roseicyclus sp.]|uniref:potassium channel family protein n=1 Tax=Roseicyclus sp. TaxID=1914329 RepID=UPI003F6C65C7
MSSLRSRVHQILDGDPLTASPIGRAVNAVIISMIVVSVAVIIIESYQPIYDAEKELFILFERISVAFFTLEFIIRMWASGASYSEDDGGPRRGRIEYLTSFHGVIDLLAIMPFYLQSLFPGADLRILRLLRLLRLLKLSRYNSALEDLIRAILDERRAFVATLYILCIAIVLSSALMYYAEGAAQPEKLASIPHAMYWSLITLTTVGYGDISPVTPIGKFISSVTALLGVSTVAMFAGIISSSFSQRVARRRMIFEQELEHAYEDGVLTQEEDALLKELINRFDLSEEEVANMKSRVLQKRG